LDYNLSASKLVVSLVKVLTTMSHAKTLQNVSFFCNGSENGIFTKDKEQSKNMISIRHIFLQ